MKNLLVLFLIVVSNVACAQQVYVWPNSPMIPSVPVVTTVQMVPVVQPMQPMVWVPVINNGVWPVYQPCCYPYIYRPYKPRVCGWWNY